MKYPFTRKYPITSNYADHLADQFRASFPGVDYAVWYGDPIQAIAHGYHDVYIDPHLGNDAILIYQKEGREYRWDFCHCSNVTAKPYAGINVMMGAEIGKSGNTGYVLPPKTDANPYSGTHVHVSLRIDGQFVDPEPVLEEIWNSENTPKAILVTIPEVSPVPPVIVPTTPQPEVIQPLPIPPVILPINESEMAKKEKTLVKQSVEALVPFTDFLGNLGYRLTSRKFLVSVLTIGTVIGNVVYKWGLSIEEILMIASMAGLYVGVEGVNDYKKQDSEAVA